MGIKANHGFMDTTFRRNSSCPIFDHSKEVTFINSRFCPFSHRICLILEAKRIPYEMINVNLISKPKWFVEMNPSGKVPTILYNNEVYYESLAVCDLLDEVFETSPKLNPESAEGKAKVKMALADFDAAIRHYYTIIRSTKPMEE